MKNWKKAARIVACVLFALSALTALYHAYGLVVGGLNSIYAALRIGFSVALPAVAGAVLYVISEDSDAARRRAVRTVLVCLFAFYLLALLTSLFFGRIDFTDYAGQRAYYFTNLDLMTNFVPGETILLYLRALKYHYVGTGVSLSNLLGNVFLFMPMGFFLPCLFAAMRKWWKFLLLMVALLCAVEAMQLILCCGSCDVDDVLLNLSGALAVYFLLRLPRVRRLLGRLLLLPVEASA